MKPTDPNKVKRVKVVKDDPEGRERFKAFQDSLETNENSKYLMNLINEEIKPYIKDGKSPLVSKHDPFASKYNPLSSTPTIPNDKIDDLYMLFTKLGDYASYMGIPTEERRIHYDTPDKGRDGKFRNSIIVDVPKLYPKPKVEVKFEEKVEAPVKSDAVAQKKVLSRKKEDLVELPKKSLKASDIKRDIVRRVEPYISDLSYNASGSKVFITMSDGSRKEMTKPEFAAFAKDPKNREMIERVRMARTRVKKSKK